MSETRYLSHPGPVGPEAWRAQFRELETRMQALRGAVQEGERSFNLTGEHVERIHRRFGELGEQWDMLRCAYPFAGVPGQDACTVEAEIAYESEARAG